MEKAEIRYVLTVGNNMDVDYQNKIDIKHKIILIPDNENINIK